MNPHIGNQNLDRHGIALRIPHTGSMCLLDSLESWDAQTLHCTTRTHLAPEHPMRTASGLLAPCAIEYAAQAMALHGGLLADEGATPSAGYIASVRNVQFGVARLDSIAGALHVRATRLSGDARQVMYAFHVTDEADGMVATGRAVVVLDTPLPGAAVQKESS